MNPLTNLTELENRTEEMPVIQRGCGKQKIVKTGLRGRTRRKFLKVKEESNMTEFIYANIAKISNKKAQIVPKVKISLKQ